MSYYTAPREPEHRWHRLGAICISGAIGAGEVVFGNLKLLAVPAGTVAELKVSMQALGIDPYTLSDSVLRFLPIPAIALAARSLKQTTGQRWLQTLATACVASRLSAEHGLLVAERGASDDLMTRLHDRAVQQAALATVIGEDLGIVLPDLPAVPDLAMMAATDGYGRLRATFGPNNGADEFETPGTDISVKTSVENLPEGKFRRRRNRLT